MVGEIATAGHVDSRGLGSRKSDLLRKRVGASADGELRRRLHGVQASVAGMRKETQRHGPDQPGVHARTNTRHADAWKLPAAPIGTSRHGPDGLRWVCKQVAEALDVVSATSFGLARMVEVPCVNAGTGVD